MGEYLGHQLTDLHYLNGPGTYCPFVKTIDPDYEVGDGYILVKGVCGWHRFFIDENNPPEIDIRMILSEPVEFIQLQTIITKSGVDFSDLF